MFFSQFNLVFPPVVWALAAWLSARVLCSIFSLQRLIVSAFLVDNSRVAINFRWWLSVQIWRTAVATTAVKERTCATNNIVCRADLLLCYINQWRQSAQLFCSGLISCSLTFICVVGGAAKVVMLVRDFPITLRWCHMTTTSHYMTTTALSLRL